MKTNSLVKIKVPRAEKKVVKALDSTEVTKPILSLPDTFDGVRNKAIILILVDCGLRLGELLNIKTPDRYCQAVGCYDAVEAHKPYVKSYELNPQGMVMLNNVSLEQDYIPLTVNSQLFFL